MNDRTKSDDNPIVILIGCVVFAFLFSCMVLEQLVGSWRLFSGTRKTRRNHYFQDRC